MLTRKDFTELARAISHIPYRAERNDVRNIIARECQDSNPRFDLEWFNQAVETMNEALNA